MRGHPNLGRQGGEATLHGGLAAGTRECGVRRVLALRALPARCGLTTSGWTGHRRGNVLPTPPSQILTRHLLTQVAISLMISYCGYVNELLRGIHLQPRLRRAT